MARVLVTPRSVTRYGGHPSLDALTAAGHEVVFCEAGRQPSEEELLDLLPPCEGYLAGVEPVTEAVLQAAGKLRVISRNGTGVDSVDPAAAERAGVTVARAAGANARGVAELAVGCLFALARYIPASDAALKAGGWERFKGVELQGRTLGLLGCGAIGRHVATMACGLGMTVVAYDPYPANGFAPGPAFRFAPLDAALQEADFLTLHCPANEDGSPLLDAAAFAKMKQGVFLVNTARPSLVDHAALLDALESGHVAGAALDVFTEEPPKDTSLVQHPRVVATPHIGGFTVESVDRAMQVAVDNIVAVLNGGTPGG